ncbi:MAG: tRNA (adenosine(37)-N6)-threonylcarbamoyltransferase complex dimerization subunit type 1 TsaB [Deltaproteobacteria bacterium]|nr:tRNA (adenosine(37)-N6)-threonylcarbamoyltransferase complex dimerization subunit type 1 TsaB [Deltaproteobacteria bacterium]
MQDPPRKLLAIESATDWLSVALLEGEESVCLHQVGGSRQHAAALLPAIEHVLTSAHTTLDQLEAIAVSAGPGSFTSLRIGLATAKGLLFGRDLPAIGISTLEAMALRALESRTGAPRHEVVALLDARRGEWYAGGWAFDSGAGAIPRLSLGEGLYGPAQLAQDLRGPVVLVSPERAGWREVFDAAGLRIQAVVEGDAARPRADWVGRLAQRRLDRGEGGAAQSLTARYLRRAQAEAQRLGGPVERGEVARVDPPSR